MVDKATSRLMQRLIKEADKYDLPTRIAARFLRSGCGGEEEWIELSKTPEFRVLPEPIIVNVHNAIRNINHGMPKLVDIPDIP